MPTAAAASPTAAAGQLKRQRQRSFSSSSSSSPQPSSSSSSSSSTPLPVISKTTPPLASQPPVLGDVVEEITTTTMTSCENDDAKPKRKDKKEEADNDLEPVPGSHTTTRTPRPSANRTKTSTTKQKAVSSRSRSSRSSGHNYKAPLAHHLSYNSAIRALRHYHAVHGHLVMPYRYTVPAASAAAAASSSFLSAATATANHPDEPPPGNDNDHAAAQGGGGGGGGGEDNSSEGGYPAEWIGYDLPGTVYDMKWWLQHVRDNTERVNELNAIGFVWGRLQPKWNLVVEALVHYLLLHQNLIVPSNYVVPMHNDDNDNDDAHNNWPKAVWSLPLGNIVSRIRWRGDFVRDNFKRRQQLDRMGFLWHRARDDNFWHFYDVLRHYLSLLPQLKQQQQQQQEPSQRSSGTTSYHAAAAILQIRRSYVVPDQDRQWPAAHWNYPLGQRVNEVIHFQSYVKDHPERQAMLAELGLRPHQKPSDLKWFQVCHAAAIYARLHCCGPSTNNKDNGDGGNGPRGRRRRPLQVPVHFCVPHDSDDWPEQLWGLPLGLRLQSIRLKGTYLRGRNVADADLRRRQLDALGFVWSNNNNDEAQFRQFVRALTIYKARYGTAVVPHKFIVPKWKHDDANDQDDATHAHVAWPAELAGYRLGYRVGRVRNERCFIENRKDRRAELRRLGFCIKPRRSDGGVALSSPCLKSQSRQRRRRRIKRVVVPA